MDRRHDNNFSSLPRIMDDIPENQPLNTNKKYKEKVVRSSQVVTACCSVKPKTAAVILGLLALIFGLISAILIIAWGKPSAFDWTTKEEHDSMYYMPKLGRIATCAAKCTWAIHEAAEARLVWLWVELAMMILLSFAGLYLLLTALCYPKIFTSDMTSNREFYKSEEKAFHAHVNESHTNHFLLFIIMVFVALLVELVVFLVYYPGVFLFGKDATNYAAYSACSCYEPVEPECVLTAFGIFSLIFWFVKCIIFVLFAAWVVCRKVQEKDVTIKEEIPEPVIVYRTVPREKTPLLSSSSTTSIVKHEIGVQRTPTPSPTPPPPSTSTTPISTSTTPVSTSTTPISTSTTPVSTSTTPVSTSTTPISTSTTTIYTKMLEPTARSYMPVRKRVKKQKYILQDVVSSTTVDRIYTPGNSAHYQRRRTPSSSSTVITRIKTTKRAPSFTSSTSFRPQYKKPSINRNVYKPVAKPVPKTVTKKREKSVKKNTYLRSGPLMDPKDPTPTGRVVKNSFGGSKITKVRNPTVTSESSYDYTYRKVSTHVPTQVEVYRSGMTHQDVLGSSSSVDRRELRGKNYVVTTAKASTSSEKQYKSSRKYTKLESVPETKEDYGRHGYFFSGDNAVSRVNTKNGKIKTVSAFTHYTEPASTESTQNQTFTQHIIKSPYGKPYVVENNTDNQKLSDHNLKTGRPLATIEQKSNVKGRVRVYDDVQDGVFKYRNLKTEQIDRFDGNKDFEMLVKNTADQQREKQKVSSMSSDISSIHV